MNYFFSILTLFIASVSFSQISFNTGSSDLDADLNTINAEAKVDLGIFKADLSADYDVTSREIDYMFSIGMEPGEVYLSLEISNISGNSVNDVVECYQKNKGKGWGVIAKEMGIKPGSSEFHALKGNSKSKKEKVKNNKKGGNGNGNAKNKKK